MEAKREQALVGLFVLVAGGLLIITLVLLSGALTTGDTTFHAFFKNAGGLQPGSEVRDVYKRQPLAVLVPRKLIASGRNLWQNTLTSPGGYTQIWTSQRASVEQPRSWMLSVTLLFIIPPMFAKSCSPF